FINWTSGSGKGVADRMLGVMADVTVAKEADGDTVIRDYGVRPLVAHVESEVNGSTVYFLEDYTQAKSFLNEIRKRDAGFSYRYCEDLCADIIDRNLWRR
ncbi:MAG: CapA family protein, partial [Lachnospiraceae bacterium]|nr:CapA family protein [Lachnospiraceae bacterium]